MKVIRKSTFETNSSSTHAIAIAKSSEGLEKPRKLRLSEEGEYGWEITTYSDQLNKFTYLAILAMEAESIKGTDYVTYLEEEEQEDLNSRDVNELSRLFSELEEIGFSFDEDCKTEIKTKLKNSQSYYYYIDHSLEGVPIYLEMMEDTEMLKRYMLSPKSFITTGNDNDDTDIFEGPNRKFDLGLTSETTEWGSTRYNLDNIKDSYDIRYKGN